MSPIKPNFVCIGAQKAGTTWLYGVLQHHPDVWMPPVKEIHYFDAVHLKHIDWRQQRVKQLQAALGQFLEGNVEHHRLEYLTRMTITEKVNDDYYLSLFKEADKKIIGDITPDYSALNDAGFAHMARLLPEAKIVFIMRNPIKRAWSQAVMRKRQQLAANIQIHNKQWIKVMDNNRNYRLSNYIRTVHLCKKHFAPENLLFLIYDDICSQPLATIEKICTFLQIDYQEAIFADLVAQKFNANPKCEIPLKVEAFLQRKLDKQRDFVQQSFNPLSFQM